MSEKPVYFTFAAEVATDGGGLASGFSGVAYSGGVVPQFGWLGDVAIDLSTLTLPPRTFALLNHDETQRVGHCRAVLDGGALRVVGSFSKTTPAGQTVAGEFAEGAPWELSVGIQGRLESYDRPCQIVLNGREMTVDGVFRDARLMEVSFVPAGADPNTHVSAFARSKPEDPPMTDTADRLAALDARVAELTAALAAETARAESALAELAAQRGAARLAAVKTLFQTAGLEFSDEKAGPYLAMDDAQFSAVREAFGAIRPSPDPALFTETATAGKPSTPPVVLAATDVYAARRRAI